MVKFVALYKKPQNPAEFDEHYFNVHVPLVDKIPGLKKNDVYKVTGSPMGDSEYYLIAELYFDTMEDMKNGMSSPEGRATGKDVMVFAKGLVTMMFVEEGKITAHAG